MAVGERLRRLDDRVFGHAAPGPGHILQNLGGRPVRLVSAAFEDGEPGLELVGAKVAGLDRAIGSYQMLPSFPPVSRPPEVDLGPLKNLEGYVIRLAASTAPTVVTAARVAAPPRRSSRGPATRTVRP